MDHLQHHTKFNFFQNKNRETSQEQMLLFVCLFIFIYIVDNYIGDYTCTSNLFLAKQALQIGYNLLYITIGEADAK